MKTFITAFPIDKALQEEIGIYDSGYVKSISVGRVLSQLVEAGYTDISSYVEQYSHYHRDIAVDKKNFPKLVIHCTK